MLLSSLSPHDAAIALGLVFTVPLVAGLMAKLLIEVVLSCRRL
ncbi:hypothetical protein QYF52_25665 [Paenibacillus polymyxa]|nr:hypothetical protein [Paenibacillus polymyxa]MDN4081317.1 hypothetical protein [Paenibacillus polymyxa]MDN4116959.1 hypothetical protein [Paenibacillus polymyxa]